MPPRMLFICFALNIQVVYGYIDGHTKPKTETSWQKATSESNEVDWSINLAINWQSFFLLSVKELSP
jgi:hypothetical protein